MSQQQDDAFVKTFVMVLAALVVFTISVFVLAQIMAGSATTKAFEPVAVAERTTPVGQVKVAGTTENTATIEAPAAQKSGEEIYNTACTACHGMGVMGAPKFGDNAAWAPRIAKGVDVVLKSALNGLNTMPPRGGNPSLSDEDIKKTVEYMLASVQIKTTEQPAPVETPPASPASEVTAPPAEQPAPVETPPAPPASEVTAPPAEQPVPEEEAAPPAEEVPPTQ